MLLLPAAVAQSDSSGDWLDDTTNWNTPGASIPQAPTSEGGNNLTNCQEGSRLATLPEDELIQAAGWTLTGAAQIYGATTVVQGMSNADGMCRPLDYQVFVFTSGEFSGTLSPTPMDSRTDGSLQQYDLYREGAISATFSRYAPQDALCCASRVSRISYTVEIQDEQSALVPNFPAETESVAE